MDGRSAGSAVPGPGRGILVLDMSYTLRMYGERHLQQALDSRHLGGFFSQVISVHPLAGLFEHGGERYGIATTTTVGEGHVFVEGKLGRTRWLRTVLPLNFFLAQVSLIRFLVRLGRESKVAVVRIGDPYYLGIFGWVVAKLLRVPLAIRVPFRYDELRRVTGRATMPRMFRYGWVEKRLERIIFPRCDLIAGANEDNMRYGLENGGHQEVATVFPYGVLLHSLHWMAPEARPSAEAALAELGLTGQCFVATVARLEQMKRLPELIHTIADLIAGGCDVKSLIVGEGSLRSELLDLCRSLGVEHAVVFAGNRDQEWIATVLPHAAAIVSPHMGRALAEAALGGVPIVAFDYDWQREVVADGETGYLVPDGDVPQMARRTRELLTDRARARTMGRNAREKVLRMMDPQRLVEHERAVYSALLEAWSKAKGRSGRRLRRHLRLPPPVPTT
jgi:glycosyltransferase involved in cell wall biosynthesis